MKNKKSNLDERQEQELLIGGLHYGYDGKTRCQHAC